MICAVKCRSDAHYTLTKIIDSLCHWENIPAPPTHRMVMQDVGFAIANKYSALVVEYGSKQPNTFLPLFFPEGVSELTTEIQHFVLRAWGTLHFVDP